MARSRSLTKDEAVLLLGLMIADSDGERLAVEVDAALTRMEGRRARIDSSSRAYVEGLAAAARGGGKADILAWVAQTLQPGERLWAMQVAVAVACADGNLDAAELDGITEIAEALGVLRSDAVRLVVGSGPPRKLAAR